MFYITIYCMKWVCVVHCTGVQSTLNNSYDEYTEILDCTDRVHCIIVMLHVYCNIGLYRVHCIIGMLHVHCIIGLYRVHCIIVMLHVRCIIGLYRVHCIIVMLHVHCNIGLYRVVALSSLNN